MLSHSFNPLIRRQMIMLPLHGQNTAALYIHSGQAILFKRTKRNVFDKQPKFLLPNL